MKFFARRSGPWVLLAAFIACGAESRITTLSLHGSLAPFVEGTRSSLSGCVPNNRTYNRPFWRAPYRECRDSMPAGWQFLEVDADSVVTELIRVWMVPTGQQQAFWDREADRLSSVFGQPSRSINIPWQASPADMALGGRTHCAAWRGPDSVTAALRLQAPSDAIGPTMTYNGWRLSRYVRNGPLSDAIDCGLRDSAR